MSTIRDAINAIKQTLILSEKVQRVAEGVTQPAGTVAEHERRLIRLETKWETAIQLAAIQRSRPLDN